MIPIDPRSIDLPNLAVGVDPGSRIAGIGIVRSEHNKLIYIDHFPIKIPESYAPADKLLFFADHFQLVLEKFESGVMVIESLFTAKNISSILKLSHVRGVAMMLAARSKWEVVEVAPATVKVSVTGYGRATKEQVQYMVQKILKMNELPMPLDCSDALALAICHLGQSKLKNRLRMMS